jgi:hypothetical protein
MRDHLLDLVSHTHDLGCIELVKIVGTDKATVIRGIAEDRSVIMDAQFVAPVAEFEGTFGMPNLAKLKILLNLPEYRENAVITIGRRDTGVPENLTFVNAAGDFRNSYRFMSTEIVNEKVKTVKAKGSLPPFQVEFEPTVAAILRLKMQAQANAEETNFQCKTEDGDLKFFFGDHSSHAGNFVFEAGVTGEIKRAWSWPVAAVMSILSLTGDKTMRISDGGHMEIAVDSGLAQYKYTLPAHTK